LEELIPQLYNLHGVNYVRQAEIHAAEPLMPDPSAFEVKWAIEKLNCHKSRGADKIQAELKQGVEQFTVRSTNLLFDFE
jgi:hypothetical protein